MFNNDRHGLPKSPRTHRRGGRQLAMADDKQIRRPEGGKRYFLFWSIGAKMRHSGLVQEDNVVDRDRAAKARDAEASATVVWFAPLSHNVVLPVSKRTARAVIAPFFELVPPSHN